MQAIAKGRSETSHFHPFDSSSVEKGCKRVDKTFFGVYLFFFSLFKLFLPFNNDCRVSYAILLIFSIILYYLREETSSFAGFRYVILGINDYRERLDRSIKSRDFFDGFKSFLCCGFEISIFAQRNCTGG